MGRPRSGGPPSPAEAFGFGSDLARLHLAGAVSFGAPWPGCIASLPLDNTPGDSWPRWYAERRLLPFADQAGSAAVLAVIDRIEDLAGPAEPPARIHGDCWSGNVLWSGGRGWLIDPAAHGGHRETALAMLALFGAPHLAGPPLPPAPSSASGTSPPSSRRSFVAGGRYSDHKEQTILTVSRGRRRGPSPELPVRAAA